VNSNTSIKQIKTKSLSKFQLQKRIQEIFDYASSNTEALFEIYKLIFPDIEQIQKIEGHPVADKNLWTYIWRMFIQLDRKCHPQEFAGAIWINKGFGMNSGLKSWSIDISKCKVIYAKSA
jgi:hypothetical protein